MTRLKTIFIMAICAVAAACAFGSYSALIPPGEVVLPLGTASVAAEYSQSIDDPSRWDVSTGESGIPESYEIRQEGYGYWLDEDMWLVFARMEGRDSEYIMQIAIPEESVDGGYIYNYAMGKQAGNRLFVKFPDCDDLPIDTVNALGLDADCALTTYEQLKQVFAETEASASYNMYYELD